MASTPSQGRLLATLRTMTASQPNRWIEVDRLAAALGCSYRAAALAAGEAKVAGVVDIAGMPPHSIMLTDAGRHASVTRQK